MGLVVMYLVVFNDIYFFTISTFFTSLCSSNQCGSNACNFVTNDAKMIEIFTIYYASSKLSQHLPFLGVAGAGVIDCGYLNHFCTVFNKITCVRTASIRRTQLCKKSVI